VDRERVLKYMNSHRQQAYYLKQFLYSSRYIVWEGRTGKGTLLQSKLHIQATYSFIIDPVYLFIEGHVSDEYDVKRFLHGTLNDLRAKHNMSVVLIHHPHKTRVDQGGKAVDFGSEELWVVAISRIGRHSDTVEAAQSIRS